MGPVLVEAREAVRAFRGYVAEMLGSHRGSSGTDLMDVLLDDHVAAQPGVIEPVAHLKFHLAPRGLSWERPKQSRVVGDVHGPDVANGSVANALNEFALWRIVAIAQAGNDRQVFPLRRRRWPATAYTRRTRRTGDPRARPLWTPPPVSDSPGCRPADRRIRRPWR